MSLSLFGSSSTANPISTSLTASTNPNFQNPQQNSSIFSSNTSVSSNSVTISRSTEFSELPQNYKHLFEQIESFIISQKVVRKYIAGLLDGFVEIERQLQVSDEIRKSNHTLTNIRQNQRHCNSLSRELRSGQEYVDEVRGIATGLYTESNRSAKELPSKFFHKKLNDFRTRLTQIHRMANDIEQHLNFNNEKHNETREMNRNFTSQDFEKLFRTQHQALIKVTSRFYTIHQEINGLREAYRKIHLNRTSTEPSFLGSSTISHKDHSSGIDFFESDQLLGIELQPRSADTNDFQSKLLNKARPGNTLTTSNTATSSIFPASNTTSSSFFSNTLLGSSSGVNFGQQSGSTNNLFGGVTNTLSNTSNSLFASSFGSAANTGSSFSLFPTTSSSQQQTSLFNFGTTSTSLSSNLFGSGSTSNTSSSFSTFKF